MENYQRVPLAPRHPSLAPLHAPEIDVAVEFLYSPWVAADPKAQTPLRDVYARYVDWCEQRGLCRISKVYFRHALIRAEITQRIVSPGYRRVVGLRLL